MLNFKRIVIYSILFTFVANIVLFDFVYAANSSNTPECSGGFSYSKEDKKCVCEGPGYGISEDGQCVYSCSVCTSTSINLQKYINLQVELLQILRDDVKEQEKQSISPNKAGLFGTLFSAKKFNLKSYFKRKRNNFIQTANSIISKTVILSKSTTTQVKNLPKSALGRLENAMSGIAILFRSKPYVRDWGKLLDIDLTLADVTWDLVQDGYWPNSLSQKSLNELNIVRTKYSKNDANISAMFEQFNFVGNLRYQDLMFFMKQMNVLMISFVSTYSSYEDVNAFLRDVKSDAKGYEWLISNGRIKIVFNQKYLENLFNDYRCAQGGACNSGFEEIKKMFKFMPTIKKGFSETTDIINKANKELVEAFSSKKDRKNDSNKFGLTDKQLELLRTIYGVDTTKLTQQQGLSYHTFLNRGTWSNMISFDLKDTLGLEEIVFKRKSADLASNIENDDNFRYMNLTGLTAKEKEEYEMLSEYLDADSLDVSLESALKNTLEFVIGEKNKSQQVVLLYDQVSSSAYFFEISELIQYIIKELIGTKGSDGLIKNLGKTCELQCANKGNENCYFK